MNRLEIEEKVWSHIDGDLTEKEKAEIAALVKTEPVWKETYQKLLSVHQMLNSSELEEPSMRFSRNVMEDIAKLQIAPATRTYINKNVIYGLGIFFGVMIVGLLIFITVLINAAPATPSSAAFDANIDRLDWGKLLDNTWIKVLMMANTVLVLMLADRYFSRKKQAAAGK